MTERTARDVHVEADGALLFLLHSLLRVHWSPVGVNDSEHHSPLLEPHAFGGNVSLLPSVVYDIPRTDDRPLSDDYAESHVHVRAIRVQSKLYVHFVSSRATLRLDLVYVR